MNQTSKSKSPKGEGEQGWAAWAVWLWGESWVHGEPSPGPHHQFMMQFRFRVIK